MRFGTIRHFTMTKQMVAMSGTTEMMRRTRCRARQALFSSVQKQQRQSEKRVLSLAVVCMLATLTALPALQIIGVASGSNDDDALNAGKPVVGVDERGNLHINTTSESSLVFVNGKDLGGEIRSLQQMLSMQVNATGALQNTLQSQNATITMQQEAILNLERLNGLASTTTTTTMATTSTTTSPLVTVSAYICEQTTYFVKEGIQGYFYSHRGFGSEDHEDDLDCSTHFTLPSGYTLLFRIVTVDLEAEYDFLRVGGTSYTAASEGTTLRTSTGFTVSFTSDGSITNGGFAIQFQLDPEPTWDF